jgi:transposase InsO family protein
VLHLRRKGLGPAMIAGRLDMHASTVHRVLVRAGVSRLRDTDRATRTPVRRYEHARPGDLVHLDIKKLGNIPAGGGHRVHGRAIGNQHSQADKTGRVNAHRQPLRGYGYLHSAVDDHSRIAYSEIHADETAATATGFLTRARAWFARECGVEIVAVLTDNGSCYRSRHFAAALAAAGIKHRRTRPYRPQTNGKVERFNRTLQNEWAYAKAYRSESARRAALPRWLHEYNHHRPHTALGGQPPASRVLNLSGQNI